jgi:hypothetical protein
MANSSWKTSSRRSTPLGTSRTQTRPTPARASNGPGGLTYQLDEEALVWPLNTAAKHENYEVCAGFETKSSADDMYLVGVRFWSLDDDNYYEANIFPTDQTYEINAYKQGKSVGGADDKQDDAIVKGESVTNEISVTVNGNVATPLVNGKKVADVTAERRELFRLRHVDRRREHCHRDPEEHSASRGGNGATLIGWERSSARRMSA